MVFNSEFKVKEFNADSKQCRRTVLAPRYGKAATRLLLVPHEKSDQQRFMFCTSERIIGLGSFPIHGDPNKVYNFLLPFSIRFIDAFQYRS